MPHIPFSIGLETIAHCNAKCVMCPISLPGTPKGTMKDELFTKIVDELRSWPTKPVMSLHGTGEPTLYKRLPERIRILSEIGIYSKLVTNGSLLNEKLCRAVLLAGASNIEFSVESLDKAVYESIRPGLDLDEVLTNFISTCRLRDELLPSTMISWIFIAHSDNIPGFPQVHEFFKKHCKPGDQIVFHPRHNFGGKFPNYGVGPSNASCWQATHCFNVLYDGTVNICCVDDNNTMVLGDVNQNTIVEIYNSEKYRNIVRAHQTGNRGSIPVCASCNVPETSMMHRTIPY